MSTAEILSLISTISYIVSAVCLILALFLWFYFKIPSVIGDLSGRTARKAIAKMRASKERAGGQGYRPSAANVNRGKLTDAMQYTGQRSAEPMYKPAAQSWAAPAGEDQMPETGLLAGNRADMAPSQATELLTNQPAGMPYSQPTELLDGSEATGMLVDENVTVPLFTEPKPMRRAGGKVLTMLDDVMLLHTDEVIC